MNTCSVFWKINRIHMNECMHSAFVMLLKFRRLNFQFRMKRGRRIFSAHSLLCRHSVGFIWIFALESQIKRHKKGYITFSFWWKIWATTIRDSPARGLSECSRSHTPPPPFISPPSHIKGFFRTRAGWEGFKKQMWGMCKAGRIRKYRWDSNGTHRRGDNAYSLGGGWVWLIKNKLFDNAAEHSVNSF